MVPAEAMAIRRLLVIQPINYCSCGFIAKTKCLQGLEHKPGFWKPWVLAQTLLPIHSIILGKFINLHTFIFYSCKVVRTIPTFVKCFEICREKHLKYLPVINGPSFMYPMTCQSGIKKKR